LVGDQFFPNIIVTDSDSGLPWIRTTYLWICILLFFVRDQTIGSKFFFQF
jgi:hypothetical protein